MNRLFRTVFAAYLLSIAPVIHSASEWSEIERIVAVGDVHGDYDQFVDLLRETGLIDKRNRWTGGSTHLVQTGDLPDRGPDTRKIMDLLIKLEKAASKDGGGVHALIGNHEVMNIRNDLRYVHPGEYEAFKDRNSKRRQAMYYDQTIEHVKTTRPEEEWPVFDKAYKKDWEEKYPLGYVEHRLAWAATGEYGKWVLSHNAAIKVNDTLFLHGGLSTSYANTPLEEINIRARTELVDPGLLGPEVLINASDGPFWYRGWAELPETAENEALLDQVLAGHGASRMVIGHTPLMPAVVPRFGGKVLVIDVGLAEHYGSGSAGLVIDGDEIYALQRGTRLDIPSDKDGLIEYLGMAAELESNPARIEKYIDALLNPEPVEAGPVSEEMTDQAAEVNP